MPEYTRGEGGLRSSFPLKVPQGAQQSVEYSFHLLNCRGVPFEGIAEFAEYTRWCAAVKVSIRSIQVAQSGERRVRRASKTNQV